MRFFWVVTELYYPEPNATGYFLTKIAEGLAGNYPVSVVCGQPSYDARGVKAPYYEVRKGVTIFRCRSTTFNKDVIGFRLLNIVTFSVMTFYRTVQSVASEDVVLVVTNPPTLPFIVAAACFLKRAKCILLIHDVYPEVLVSAGFLGKRSIPVRILAWLNKKLYTSVDAIVVLGRDMLSLVRGKIESTDEKRIVIIPNWGDVDAIRPAPKESNILLEQLGLGGKFIIQYSGNMGRTHGLEYIAGAASQLSNHEDIHFLFIGSGAKKRWLEERRLSNATILPLQPRDQLSISLNACDITVISFIPGMSGVSVPSRMYNVLASGKPILAIAEDDSELALLVREERIGWVVAPGDIEAVVRTALEAKSNPLLLQEMGARARKVAEEKFSYPQVISLYRDLLDPFGIAQQPGVGGC